MARNVNKLLLGLMIGLVALSWVGAVSGVSHGQYPGFHADEKGYPGWCSEDQHDKPMVDTDVITIELRAVDDSNGNFHGAGPVGGYPGERPGP